MILPDYKEFRALARQANLVPVWTHVSADLLTPVSAYLHLTRGGGNGAAARRGYSFLLESVEGGENVARYTYMGADPFLILRYRMTEPKPGLKNKLATAGVAEIVEKPRLGTPQKPRYESGDISEIARKLLRSFRPARVETLPPFSAGCVGFLTYDLIRLREPVPLPEVPLPRPGSSAEARKMPDAILMFYSTLLIFDHVKHQIVIVRNVRCRDAGAEKKLGERELKSSYDEAIREIRKIEKKLKAPLALLEESGAGATSRSAKPPSFVPNMTRTEFVEKVEKAKKYIHAGDIFQVVLSQRFQAGVRAGAFQIYRALRRVNPAPYLFYLQLGEDAVLGSSPEMLVKVTGDEIEYRPIAGTRPRGKDPERDRQMERELLADEKERAEHVMLVDLGRNDVGRVSQYGSVSVPNLMFVERYSHVMHLVSSVRGKLRPELDAWDALWACFPAGTLSGAPKVRAMQIVSELEPTRRGLYGGTVLYLDLLGNLNSCIAIRSMVVSGGKATVQVGAGIVADSIPEREFEETINKGRALLNAIQIAESEFSPSKRPEAGRVTRRRTAKK